MKNCIIFSFFLLLIACQSPSQSESKTQGEAESEINCAANPDDIAWQALLTENCNRLSDFGLFESASNPRESPRFPGLAFKLATELFTDYAHKYRFFFVPEGKIIYQSLAAFDFPIGSVLVKTFVLPESNQANAANDMIETRLLIRRENGWVGLPYVWNDTKTEAYLVLTGRAIEKQITVDGVGEVFDYQVPSVADCKTCHIVRTNELNKTAPIGLKMRHLNRNIIDNGEEKNQLLSWQEKGLLQGLPADLSQLASIPVWQDSSRELQDRAKGYLDINCSHCHTPGGKGSESGMYLEYWRAPDLFDHGICKRPGGFNGGDKGLVYDIVPGDADQSLIPYRMSLLASEGDAKGQMPPLARHVNHVEAIELIKQWINAMPYQECAESNN